MCMWLVQDEVVETQTRAVYTLIQLFRDFGGVRFSTWLFIHYCINWLVSAAYSRSIIKELFFEDTTVVKEEPEMSV